MAGSRNRPAWPIAPGVPNSGVPRKIELTAGSAETEEELMKARFEVAQNAGLKHVEVINGDQAFYPQPMKDYDYPWAGSLRPVSKVAGMRKEGGGETGAMPWAGTLRHVDSNKQKKRPKHDDEDDMYGNAPWMGTLRHVSHENKVTSTFTHPQFKRYPDEDAPNPFSGMQGRDAKPAYPLTPAAVINGNTPNLEDQRDQMEDVDRIRTNLRETRTVSSALLKVLMPKLLKEHESKYEPLGHDESFNIMEEILAMQIGLNADQKVEDNNEAEQIIRAITHGEIDHQVYTQMADDLESAAQMKRMETKKKPKKAGKAADGKKKKSKKAAAGGAALGGSEPSASEVEPSASESNLVPAQVTV